MNDSVEKVASQKQNDAAGGTGKNWDDVLNDAFGALMKSNKLNPEAKNDLKDSQQQWINFQSVENGLIDKVANDPGQSSELKQELVKARAEELIALNDSKLTPTSAANSIDRQLQMCLSIAHFPGDAVGCLVDAQNNWQVLKNETLQDMSSIWSHDRLAELKNSETAWEKFAGAEDKLLLARYLDDGPADAGINRLKAEINVEKDRALELNSLNVQCESRHNC